MAPVVGIVVNKAFTYRGDTDEEWSNKYFLSGPIPASDTEWRTLFDQVCQLECTVYNPGVKIVSGYAYADDADDAQAVWGVDLTLTSQEVPGTLAVASTEHMAGDQAGLVWWKTSRRSTKGKPIYLRKYYHGGGTQGTTGDQISPTCLTAYNVLASALQGGGWGGARVLRSQKFSESLVQAQGSEWVTTRTLKRRGKKKSTSQ